MAHSMPTLTSRPLRNGIRNGEPHVIDLRRDGDIHVITMNNGPNMIDPSWQVRMLKVLDVVEADSEGNAGLVITGEGKFSAIA